MLTDLRVTIRALAARPAFALLVITILGLGLGAATAVFCVVDAALLRPLPFTDPDCVAIVSEVSAASPGARVVSPITFDDWKNRNQAFAELAAFRYWETVNLEDPSGEPESVTLVTGSEHLFRALGVAPLIGRTYREEQSPRGGSEAVLSDHLWRRRYGADPGVIGRVISVRGTPTTIVGVMPPIAASLGVGFGDLWTCLYLYDIQEQRATSYRSRYLTVVGRLRSDLSFEQAAARMAQLQRLLWTEPTSVAEGFDVHLRTLEDELNGAARLPLGIVAGAVAMLLIIMGANVATLMLARATARRRETAIRLALGAGPARVFRLMLLEGLLLTLAGGVVGLGMAWAALRVTAHLATSLPRLHEAGLSPQASIAALALSLVMAVIVSGVPVLSVGRMNVAGALGESGGRSGTGGPRANRARRVLVGVQMALACLLLITGGLLLRSFAKLLAVDPRIRKRPRHLSRSVRSQFAVPGRRGQTRFYRELMDRLQAAPAVEASGALLYFPYKPKLWPVVVFAEGAATTPESAPIAYFNQVAGDVFAAMGIPLLAGRGFTAREIWEPNPAQPAVINRAMAERLFGAADPIGRRFRSGDGDPGSR